ncbi:MAG: hypothetical protein LBN42_03230 [Oscillospiraceae bacterium]|jgi:hypothetical protein|nr:hypothetical protein [Oscillospiraceae bacterium]
MNSYKIKGYYAYDEDGIPYNIRELMEMRREAELEEQEILEAYAAKCAQRYFSAMRKVGITEEQIKQVRKQIKNK